MRIRAASGDVNIDEIPGAGGKFEERRIDDKSFRLTSATNPTIDEWYAFGTLFSDVDMLNYLIYYNWNESTASYWALPAHAGFEHLHSTILTTGAENL